MCSCISHAVLEIIYFYWRDEFARTSKLSSALWKKCHVVFNLKGWWQEGLPHQLSPSLPKLVLVNGGQAQHQHTCEWRFTFFLSGFFSSVHPSCCRAAHTSRPGWMGLWATWARGRVFLPVAEGWNQVILKVPSNPYDWNDSMILWNSRICFLPQSWLLFPCPLRCVLSLGLMQTPGQDGSLILQEPSNAAASSHWAEDKHCTCRSSRCPRTCPRNLHTPSESQL